MAVLRHVGKVAAGAVLGGLVARLGLLALGVLVFGVPVTIEPSALLRRPVS